jgi:DNA mismatch endonuclease (patch repair protein)
MAPESWASSVGTRASMLGNRGRDTKPEVVLRSALHAAGFRFRKDFRLEIGGVRLRPDVVFTRARVAVFVDGCFWHSCPVHGTQPTRNADYWRPKLARNVERDREQDVALAESAWSVVRIWEHEEVDKAVERVAAAVAEGIRARKP